MVGIETRETGASIVITTVLAVLAEKPHTFVLWKENVKLAVRNTHYDNKSMKIEKFYFFYIIKMWQFVRI